MKPLCTALLLGLTATASASETAAERFTCTSGSSVRLVSIYRSTDEGDLGNCRVDYTKNGDTKTVWSATRGYAYCVKRALELVTKLTRGNYSCAPATVDRPGGSPQ
jgi:hypothetical protein